MGREDDSLPHRHSACSKKGSNRLLTCWFLDSKSLSCKEWTPNLISLNRRPRSRDRSISSAIPGASVQCLAALSPSAGFGASPGFRTVLNNIQPRLMPWGELQLSCSIMPMFATDLLVLYTRAHDYLPNSRSSVSTASRRKRPDADCRSDYTSRLLRDR